MHRKLPGNIHWEDFATAYDPVQFSLIIDFVDRLPDERDVLHPICDVVSCPLEHDVTNHMDLFSDHTAYWNNAEEVLEPILKRIKAI